MKNNRFEKITGYAFLDALLGNTGIMEIHLTEIEVGEDAYSSIAALMRERASVDGVTQPDIPDGGGLEPTGLPPEESDEEED